MMIRRMTTTIASAVIALVIAQAASAQGISGGSDSEKFLKALREGNGPEVVETVNARGGNVVNYRGYDGNTALTILARQRNI